MGYGFPQNIIRTSALVGALLVSVSTHAQSFTLVGLPPNGTSTRAQGISADGRVVSGMSTNAAGLASGWSWTRETGLTTIPSAGLMPTTNSFGISGDGTWMVGETGGSRQENPKSAYRYNRLTGEFQNLGGLSGSVRSRALDASADGSVVVGYSDLGPSALNVAWRWTPEGGMQTFENLFGLSTAHAVSADGNTIVGVVQGDNTRPWVWRAGVGVQQLPRVSEFGSHAYGVNSTGDLIVGDDGGEGVLWRNGVRESLGFLPNTSCIAHAISDDGSVIVGQIFGTSSPRTTAGIWQRDRGWLRLSEYLAEIGVNVPSNVTLTSATNISSDGRTIVGYSNGPIGFVATIPAPCIGTLVMGAIGVLMHRRRP